MSAVRPDGWTISEDGSLYTLPLGSAEIRLVAGPRCKGRLEIAATVTTLSAVKAILECLGLLVRPPPAVPAREPEQGA